MWTGRTRPRRRLATVVSMATAMSLTAALYGGGAAQAHETLQLTVNHDGRGNVWTEVAWADGHPVTETVAATMMAVSAAGQQVGPVPLVRLPGQPTVVYDKTLPTGEWRVTVDAALPGVGHCEAVVRVGSPAPPAGITRCADPAPATTAGPAVTTASAASRPGSGADWRWATPSLLLVLAGLIAWAGPLRRRSTTGLRWPGGRSGVR